MWYYALVAGLVALGLTLCGCQDVKAHCKAQTNLDYNTCVIGLTN